MGTGGNGGNSLDIQGVFGGNRRGLKSKKLPPVSPGIPRNRNLLETQIGLQTN
jgi:hypothetical protein